MARINKLPMILWRRIHAHHARHLSARLMLYLLLIGLIPVLIAGYVVNAQFESNLLMQTEQDLKHRLSEMNDGIETYLRTQEKNLHTFAMMPTLQKMMRDASHAYAEEGTNGTGMQEVEDTYLDFLATYAENNFYTDMYLISAEGDVLVSLLHGAMHGVNLRQDGWRERPMGRLFLQSLNQVQALTSIPELDEQGVFFYVATPILERGVIIGCVMLKVNVKNIQVYYLDSLQLSEDAHMFVAQQVAGQWRRVYLSGLSENKSLNAAEINTFERHLPQLHKMLYADNYYAVANYLPSFAAVVVLAVPRQYVMAGVQRSRLLVFIFMLISALIIVLIASRLASNFIRPIRELGKSFHALGQGDTKVSVAVERSDEIGLLARQFNDMAEHLQKTKSQLVQTEKLASIGHLAAGVAHEINNPLGIVTSNVAILEEYTGQYRALAEYVRNIPADAQAVTEILAHLQSIYRQQDLTFVGEDTCVLLQETRHNLARVRDIVSSMQVFAEIDQEAEQPCDLVMLMDSCLDEFAVNLPANITLLRKYRGMFTINARPKQLKRAVLHILDNALKAVATKEKGRIRVRITQQAEQAIITLDDNGVGISTENINKIFNPFFTTRPVGQGLGMGLAITYSIITAHGGDIQVQSAQGRGTRIRIMFPLHTQAANAV